MSRTITIAEYLFIRLKEMRVDALHGVPGDYNLELLDYVAPSGLSWVGNTNELNAGYAADGYARFKGCGALMTTFGVGELSAMNAIAGAYTEYAAVVHIVGTPARSSQDSRAMIHHTLGDGDYQHFEQMSAHIAVAQTHLLDPASAASEIDKVLRQCITHSRPVYIRIPVDMVSERVPAGSLEEPLLQRSPEPKLTDQDLLTTIVDKIHETRQPAIYVD